MTHVSRLQMNLPFFAFFLRPICFLVQKEPDVRKQPLWLAVEGGDDAIVRSLLRAGADPDLRKKVWKLSGSVLMLLLF